jgi:hypothetical protein
VDPAGPSARFRFVQLELPWILGPQDGRYVLRGHAGEAAQVLVVATVGTAPRRGRRRWRHAPAEPPPERVATTRVTLIEAVPLDGDRAAAAWLAGADLEAQARAAVALLNEVLELDRVVRADPHARDVTLEQAVAVRVGVGRGEEVAAGRWTDARRLGSPPTRPAGRAATRERLAAVLAGRDVVLAAEALALRARDDLDQGRSREGALQLRAAADAALAELQAWAHHDDVARALERLAAAGPALGALAARAAQGGLDAPEIAEAQQILALLETALAARLTHRAE